MSAIPWSFAVVAIVHFCVSDTLDAKGAEEATEAPSARGEDWKNYFFHGQKFILSCNGNKDLSWIKANHNSDDLRIAKRHLGEIFMFRATLP